MPPNTSATQARAAQGDQEAWAALLERHQNRLRRMIALRLDQRLQARIDPEDVLQETYLEAATHLADYLKQPAMPFFFWLRGIAGNVLLALHRQHLGTKMRDAGREVALYRGTLPEASSAALAAQLLGRDTRPSQAAMRAERKILLQESDRARDDLWVQVGSDDQAKVYLNGREIYQSPVARALNWLDTVGPVALELGTNVLIFKVVNESLDWEGCVRLVDEAGRPAQGIRVKLTPE